MKRHQLVAVVVLLGTALIAAPAGAGYTVPAKGAVYETRCSVTSLSGMRACLAKAAGVVSSAANAGADLARKVATMGYNYVRSSAAEAWKALKSLDCGGFIAALGRFDPTTVLLSRLWKPAGTCLNEIRSGMLCAIPSFVVDVGKMVVGSAQAAWNNRGTCLTAAILAGPAGLGAGMGCGFFYWAKGQITRIASCLSAMRGNQILKVLWEEIWKLGCNIVGGLITDLVLGALSGGSSVPASIAKWVGKVSKMISPSTWMRITRSLAAKTVDAAISYTQNTMKRFAACR